MGELLKVNMIETMTKLYEQREGLFKSEMNLESVHEDLEYVSSFLGVDNKVAALVSVLVCDQLMAEKTPIRKLMKYMGFSPVDIFKLNDAVKQLKRKGWLELKERSLDRMSSRFESIEISKMLMDALHYNDPTKLLRKMPLELGEALMMTRYFIVNSMGDYELDELSEIICDFLGSLKQFKLLNDLHGNYDLDPLEKSMLVWVLIEFYQGKEIHDFNDVLELFLMDPMYANNYKKKIILGRSNLFSLGYINYNKGHLSDLSEVVLSENLKDALEAQTERVVLNKQRFKQCVLIEPQEIDTQTLIFNHDAETKMTQIHNLLSENQYQKVLDKFEKNGMKPSLTILLYGKPGTGKTEFVKQLAKSHQRAILQVDISGIKDMWVGESEKNLKRVFFEYAQALKKFPIAPILLFNEADALLGKRTKVNDSVDQMLNAMQNILLQELEDFKGIFIATSNLIHNIDTAFDRRILYKNMLDLPDEDSRFRILQNTFPEQETDVILKLAKYQLSGAQIQNIKKKFIADTILFGVSSHEIEKYAAEEALFRKGSSNTIGFVNY